MHNLWMYYVMYSVLFPVNLWLYYLYSRRDTFDGFNNTQHWTEHDQEASHMDMFIWNMYVSYVDW